MHSATGIVQAFDSNNPAARGDSVARSTRHLASGATFGVETARTSASTKVSMLGLVLVSKTLKPVRRTNARRGLAVAQEHTAASEVRGEKRDDSSRGIEEEMTTRITEIEERGEGDAILKVEGSLTLEDAKLLEEVCIDLRRRNGRVVRIDLAGLSFLDEESASLLRGLKEQPGVVFEGAHLFVRQVIEEAERGGNE